MLQHLILSLFIVVMAFLQADFPKPETLQPLTSDNVSKIQPLAAIGSDTPVDVLWSPNGQTLAAITSGQVILYKVSDLKSVFRTIPHRFDENVSFAPDGHLVIGNAIWDIQKGTSEAKLTEFFQRSPSGKLEVTTSHDGKQTLVIIKNQNRTKPLQLETGTPSWLVQIIFSPDEKFAVLDLGLTYNVLGPYDGIQLWNIETGTLVAKLDQALELIQQIEFSADGKLLVTTTNTDAVYSYIFEDVRVWDGRTGEKLNNDTSIMMLPARFSPDKKLMVYASYAGLSLWNDHEIGHLAGSKTGDISSFSKPLFSPDGKILLAAGNGEIAIWDTETAIRLGEPRLILDNEGYITDYFFSADGKRLIVLTGDIADKRVRIWDFTKPSPKLIEVIHGLTSAELSPDLKRLWGDAYINASRNRVLVDIATGEHLFTFPPNAQLDPQWKYVAYWSDQKLMITNLDQNVTTELNPLPNYFGTARFFSVKEGQAVFVMPRLGHDLNLVQVYNLQNGQVIKSFEDTPNNEYVLSEDGYLLSTDTTSVSGMTTTVQGIDQVDGAGFSLTIANKMGRFFLVPHQAKLAYIDSYGVSETGRAYPRAYTRLEVWNTQAPQKLQASWMLQANIQAYGLSSSGNLLAMANSDYEDNATIDFLNLRQPQTPVRSFELPMHNYPVFDSVRFSPHDEYLAVSADDQTYGDGVAHQYEIFLFETRQFDGYKTGGSVEPFTIPSVTSPLFSSNNQFLLANEPYPSYAALGAVYKVHLWRLKDKVELSAFAGDGIAAFSPDSALLAVHNQNSTTIYDTDTLAQGQVQPLVSIPDNEGQVKELAFSADGKRLYLIEESRVRVYGVS